MQTELSGQEIEAARSDVPEVDAAERIPFQHKQVSHLPGVYEYVCERERVSIVFTLAGSGYS